MKGFFTIGLLLIFLIDLQSQQRYDIQFMLDGHVRECIIVKPSTAPPVGGYPVVFMLHGTSGDGEKFYNISGWKELGQAENFITVFPSSLSWCFVEDGIEKHNTRWVNGNVTENPCAGPPQDYIDDIKFLKLLAGRISDTFPVNKTQIFACGFSNGSAMIHKMAVDAGDVFAAVAGTSAFLSPADSSKPLRRIPIWVMLGNLDDRYFSPPRTEVPFGGDTILSYLNRPLNAAIVCQGLTQIFTKIETPITHTYKFTESASGELSKPYIFTLVKGMTHEFPNGTNSPIDGPKLFWEFFQSSVLVNTKSNNQDAFKIQIYPNPANESMKVQFYENNLPKEIRLQLFNSLGQLVYSKKQLSTQKLELQKSKFGTGLFILRIEGDHKVITKQIVFN
ncbi:MAG: T9SS type A sorting domain-containing protein [Saprospiraceae bacterium]|nr:T9SS type A sorting domain-containing protein [Saprospiraceae bacterium]